MGNLLCPLVNKVPTFSVNPTLLMRTIPMPRPAWYNIAGKHHIFGIERKSLSYSDPEAHWTKIKNLTALFGDKKSCTLQKRSKKTLLHQRAYHEDQKFKNHRKSISMSWPLSVKQAAKITFAQSKNRTLQSIIYSPEKKKKKKKTYWNK